MAKATSKKKIEEIPEPAIVVGEEKNEILDNLNFLSIPKEELVLKDNKDGTHTVSLLKNEDLSMEEKILAFMTSRPDGEVKMNDFLKSLYPIPKNNEPAEYLKQGRNKELKGVLIKMQSEGKINFATDSYLQLGKNYYQGDNTETKFHTILTTPIVAKK